MKKLSLLLVFLTILLFILMIFSLCLGSVLISLQELINSISDSESSFYRIIRFIRLPRIFSAILCGSALSVSGVLIQNTLQNPLGSPNVLGMNAGAGFFVILIASFSTSAQLLPIFAFLGAFFTLLLVTFLGKKVGGNQGLAKHSLLLSGVALNAFLTALADGINVLIPDSIYSRATFRIGSLANIQTDVMFFAGIIIFLSILASFFLKNHLDILNLGDESAKSLGLNVEKIRFFALLLSALLCGAGISFAGLIGFVGLIVPHCSRILCKKFKSEKSRTGSLILVSVLLGSNLVLLCDLISRIAFAPYELPVGILLSLIGGVFFFYLLMKNRRKK